MILQNRNDLFKLEIPRVFIPDEIKERYLPYIQKMPTPINDITDIINWSIQSVTIPNFNYSPIEQTRSGDDIRKRGTVHKFRSASSPELLIDRKFNITFQLLDGNINYWILLETFLYYYSFDVKEPYNCDIPIHIFDAEGYRMYSTIFKNCLFTGLNEFTMSYSELTPEFKTFEATFEFNNMTIDFPKQ